jgi:hypothetical protein
MAEPETGWIPVGVASDRVVSEVTEDLTEELGDGWESKLTIYDDGGWGFSISSPEPPPPGPFRNGETFSVQGPRVSPHLKEDPS